MKRRLATLGLLAALATVSWRGPARADAGLDATLEASMDAAPPPKDSGHDASKPPDSSTPPDAAEETGSGTPAEGGVFEDVIVADGGDYFADAPLTASDGGLLSTEAGVNDMPTSSGGGCSISTLGGEDRLVAGLGLILGTLGLGLSRGRRRRRR
jgi:hypothetical protein